MDVYEDLHFVGLCAEYRIRQIIDHAHDRIRLQLNTQSTMENKFVEAWQNLELDYLTVDLQRLVYDGRVQNTARTSSLGSDNNVETMRLNLV